MSGRTVPLQSAPSSDGVAHALPFRRSMNRAQSQLRFIEAERIETPAGRLEGAVVVTPTEKLGKLDGMLVDPIELRVQYYVIESSENAEPRRHYLVPSTLTRMDRQRRALELDLENDQIDRFDDVAPDTFTRFADDDLAAAHGSEIAFMTGPRK